MIHGKLRKMAVTPKGAKDGKMMNMDNGMKLAVLIDAENISSKYIKTILDEASNNGNILFKRIYGNWTNNQMATWKDVILDNSIQPIQQYCNTVGKNASDSTMIIDAMDLLYTGRVEGFCIVSSDSDFTRLASRLRESEVFVIGMGELKTPKSFISACNKFSYLDILYSEEKQVAEPLPPMKEPKKRGGKVIKTIPQEKRDATVIVGNQESGANISNISRAIHAIIEEHSDDDGWMFSGKLGNQLMKRFPDFDVRNFGFKKLVPFIESMGKFEVRKNQNPDDPNVHQVHVRNK
ncbi:MAG: NYN domain-containing protein [Oscillospiraceae bacterium]